MKTKKPAEDKTSWDTITCPHCNGKFQVEGTMSIGLELACPYCAEHID